MRFKVKTNESPIYTALTFSNVSTAATWVRKICPVKVFEVERVEDNQDSEFLFSIANQEVSSEQSI